jgi:hypothetical protein
MPDIAGRSRLEASLERALNRAFVDARREMLDALYVEGMTYRDLASVSLDTWDILRLAVVSIFTDILSDAYQQAATSFAGAVQFGLSDDELLDASGAWVRPYARRAADSFVLASQRLLTRQAERSDANEELTHAALTQLLRSVLSSARASTNAVTEVTNAISAGETFVTDRLRSEGAEVTEIWFTQIDERVCPVCAPRHGAERGDGWVNDPPAHPNCRCYKGYRIRHNGVQVILFDDDAVARRLSR